MTRSVLCFYLLAALPCRSAHAETSVVEPCTLELGLTTYNVTIAGGVGLQKVRYAAVNEALSYAFANSLAYTTGIALAGRDLLAAALGLRWFPRGDARQSRDVDGPVKSARASRVKPYTVFKAEYGHARSPFRIDTNRGFELAATYQGLGVGFGARVDITSLFGVGVEVGVSRWTDAPASSLTLQSTTTMYGFEAHLNF